MSYEGAVSPIVHIPDVEVPGDVAEWLSRQAARVSWSPGEWLAHMVTIYARMEMASTPAQGKPLREVAEGGMVTVELP